MLQQRRVWHERHVSMSGALLRHALRVLQQQQLSDNDVVRLFAVDGHCVLAMSGLVFPGHVLACAADHLALLLRLLRRLDGAAMQRAQLVQGPERGRLLSERRLVC